MRIVRMFTTYASCTGASATPGQEIGLPDDTAAAVVEAGYAEYADAAAGGRGRRRRAKSTDTADSSGAAAGPDVTGEGGK